MKVNFIVAGTQKGGTSALNKYLKEHGKISMAQIKEVHYFDTESNFVGEADYSQYESSFELFSNQKILGEATPVYMYWYAAPRRIWEYNPQMKIILILRNPIERAYSHWNMNRTRDSDSSSFMEAIRNEEARCKEALPIQHRAYSYIDRGLYSEQIRRLWHFFPKDQVLIIKSQDLRDSPSPTLASIARFLEIPKFKEVEHKNVHSRPYSSKMSKEAYEYLWHIYYYEIKILERMLGWNCSDWLRNPYWYNVDFRLNIKRSKTLGKIRSKCSRLISRRLL